MGSWTRHRRGGLSAEKCGYRPMFGKICKLVLLNLAYKGEHDLRYPVYCTKKLKMKDIINICLAEKVNIELVCKHVPQHIYHNAVFVVDLMFVKAEDLSTDGLIYNSQACPVNFVQVLLGEDNGVRQCKIVPLDGNQTESIFKFKRQYSQCYSSKIVGVKLKRTISKIEKMNGELCRYAVISYDFVGQEHIYDTGRKIDLFKRVQGNSKHRQEPYNRTFPSVINEIKHKGATSSPKNIVTEIQNNAGGLFNMNSPSEITTDRSQVYNAFRGIDRPKSRNTGPNKNTDFTRLQLMLREGDFVKDISYVSDSERKTLNTRVFATTDSHMTWVRNFCSVNII